MAKRGAKAKAYVKRVGISGFLRRGKIALAFLGQAFYSVARYGGNMEVLVPRLKANYLGVQTTGNFSFESMKPQVEGYVTAMGDDWFKRKITGHYRRIGGKHILPIASEVVIALDALRCSGVQGGGGGPVAAGIGNVDFVDALACYQDSISGYDPRLYGSPDNYDFDRRFKDQFIITTVADGLSWLASKAGLNKYLPKGLNA